MQNDVSFQDFENIIIKVGTIISVNEFPQARKPAYQLTIDFGDKIGIKQSSAQITVHYTMQNLISKQILAVVNFPPKQIGPFVSEVLILGVADAAGDVILIVPDQSAPNGVRMF